MRDRIGKWGVRSVKVGVLGLVLAAYYLVPGLREFLHDGFSFLKARDFEGLRTFILSFGMWAPVSSVLLMTVQSVFPLVPGIALTLANAWIFGWQMGSVYSWIGALCGAVLDFGIARWYGRPVVECFVSCRYLDMTNRFFHRYGIVAIFITRLTPVIPFKLVSYGSGLTCMRPFDFALVTGIGQAPAILLYSFLGHNIGRSIQVTVVITVILILLGAATYYYRVPLERYFLPDEKEICHGEPVDEDDVTDTTER